MGNKKPTADLETQVCIVVEAIPFGRQNAVKRSVLCDQLGMNDRGLRRLIEVARGYGFIIINDQDGAGYYQSNDIDEIERQYQQDKARAMSILARQKEIRRRLKAAGRKV